MNKTVYCSVPCGKTPVCDSFYDCFYGLILPEGSARARAIRGSVPGNLNRIIECAKDYDYTFIVEDDSMFAPDTVLRLLEHDKEVVTGLCVSRQPPFRPYIYQVVENGEIAPRPLTNDDSGLIRVAATGMGGILIKNSVFSKLTKPYFYNTYEGEIEWGQDVLFAKSLVNAGIEVFCDTDVTIWHATHCSLSTSFKDNKWITTIRIADCNVEIPA
jgi:hypothetical protein